MQGPSPLARRLLASAEMRARAHGDRPIGTRWLPALVASALALAACPSKQQPCEIEPHVVELAGPERDPNLGTFRGQLLWLQTGEQTEIVVEVEPDALSVEISCEHPYANVHYRLESTDGVLALFESAQLALDEAGTISFDGAVFEPDARAIAGAGKLPAAPSIGEQAPKATLTLAVQDDGTRSLVLVVSTSTDYFNVAVATLQRDET